MAFQLDVLENFEYPDAAALQKAWPSINSSFTTSTAFPRTGTRSLKGSSSQTMPYGFGAQRRSLVCGFAIYIDETYTTERVFAHLGAGAPNSTSGSGQVVMTLTPAGTIKVFRGYHNSGNVVGTLLGETGVVMSPGFTHNHIQLKIFIHDTLGYVKVAVGGVDVLELTNQDTRHQASSDYFDYFTIFTYSSVLHLDDLYICSDDSTSLTTGDFLGDVSIIEALPVGTGTYNQLASSSAGTPYTDVDESLLNQADYNYSSTAGQKSSYLLSDIAGAPTIKGVSLQWTAGKSTPGYREVRGLSISGATETPYAYHPLSVTAVTKQQGMLVDPNTGVAWTVAGVNALEIGAEIL